MSQDKAQDNSELFSALGFQWDRSAFPDNVPVHDVKRANFRFGKMLAEYVWNASMLEGNPFTFPEVQTLIDGITVGGHKLSDEQEVLGLIGSTEEAIKLLRDGKFTFDRKTVTSLHAIVAEKQAFDAGFFRGEGDVITDVSVSLPNGQRYHPPKTEKGGQNLIDLFENGAEQLRKLPPFEQGLAYSLFGAMSQFFYDGNKRTSRLMMNGILISHGIDAITVPAARRLEYNQKMSEFYVSKDATDMMAFLVSCHPDAKLMQTAVV